MRTKLRSPRDYLGRPGHRSRGQSLVEFAIVVPVLLLLLLGAADLGRVFFARVSVANAAREAAVQGAYAPNCITSGTLGCSDPNNVAWRVHNEAGSGLTTTYTTACTGACGVGDHFTVTVSSQFAVFTPLISAIVGPTLSVTDGASARIRDPAFDVAAAAAAAAGPTIVGTPADISIEADEPTAVTYTAPTATDAKDGTVAVTCLPASGATFPLGETLVTCTATDTDGNTATATFTVTVSDEDPPACITVVNVVGLDKTVAQAVLTGAGLQIGLVTQAHARDPQQNSGVILSQDPANPACVAAGTPVNLVYNK